MSCFFTFLRWVGSLADLRLSVCLCVLIYIYWIETNSSVQLKLKYTCMCFVESVSSLGREAVPAEWSLMLMPEYSGEFSPQSAALLCLCSKENEFPHRFIVLSQFFYTVLPKLMTDGAELSYFPLKQHGGTPAFSLSSDIGSYTACTKPLACVSICCEGTLF